MTDLSGFHHLALSVSDRDASARWYADVLGLVELFREEGDERRACVMGFAGGGFAVAVVEHVGPGHEVFDATVTGLDHAAFSVGSRQDIEAWAARLTDASVDHSGVIDIPPGAILNFKDPDGIGLAMFWDRN